MLFVSIQSRAVGGRGRKGDASNNSRRERYPCRRNQKHAMHHPTRIHIYIHTQVTHATWYRHPQKCNYASFILIFTYALSSSKQQTGLPKTKHASIPTVLAWRPPPPSQASRSIPPVTPPPPLPVYPRWRRHSGSGLPRPRPLAPRERCTASFPLCVHGDGIMRRRGGGGKGKGSD